MSLIGDSTNKNDTIVGTGTSNDSIDGGNGNDILDGGDGDDVLYGGNGKDIIFGGRGRDLLYGGNGFDIVYGGEGDDQINVLSDGGTSSDNGPDVIYGDGYDGLKRNADGSVYVAADGSYVFGSYDADGIFVDGAHTFVPGNDLIRGTNGSETIYGDNGLVDGDGNPLPGAPGGNDVIYGGNGADRIYGEGGDDVLVGESGADILTGGDGNDLFVYHATAASSDSNAAATDLITDFTQGEDRIDLRPLLGGYDPETGDDSQLLAWGATVATAFGAWYAQNAAENATYVYADVDGDASTPELVVKLAGLHALTSNDFLGVLGATVNEAPEALDVSAGGPNNATIAVTLAGSDTDGTIASYTLVSLPSNGTLYVDSALSGVAATGVAYAGNNFYFTANTGFIGDVSFAYTVTDDDDAVDATPATASIAVLTSNNAPYLTPAGLLDPTFGGDGTVTTDFGLSLNENGRAVARQPDGKLVVAGSFQVPGPNLNGDWALVRYNVDGSIDTSFGVDGIVRTTVGGPLEEPLAILVQADGKIVVAGDDYSYPALVRYLSDGTLDSSFGAGGIKVIDFALAGRIEDIVLQADGKIVAAGWHGAIVDSDFAVWRINPDGSLDTGFNGSGRHFLSGLTGDADGQGVRLQSDGKIVVAGWSQNGGSYDFALARLNADGTLDTSFGSGGYVTTPIWPGSDQAYDLALQADGKIVAVGWSDTGGPNAQDYALVRYNANGSLDTGFGVGGKVTTSIGGDGAGWYDVAFSVEIQADGKIVVSGETASAVSVARYNADGSLDNSFSGDGLLRFSMSVGGSGSRDMLLQPDGNIVVAGSDNNNNGDFAIARLTGGGLPDQTVEENSAFQLTVPVNLFTDPDGDPLTYSATRADGSALPAWLSFDAPTRTFSGTPLEGDEDSVDLKVTGMDPWGFSASDTFTLTVANANDAPYVTPAGLLDPTFGGDGTVTTDRGALDREDAHAIARQPDGKLVVVGWTNIAYPDGDWLVARYNVDGSLDPTFGTGGLVRTTLAGPQETPWAVLIQLDGKILVAGDNYARATWARYNPDGSLDASFGTGGVVVVNDGIGARVTDTVLQPDGRILSTGREWTGTDWDFGVWRLNPDGSLDTSFAGTGRLSFEFGVGSSEAEGLVLQPDGRIVIGGWSHNGSDFDFTLARLNADGTLDTSFGSGGYVTTPIGSGMDQAYDIALQADGKIVAVGWTDTGGANERDIALVRYNADGSIDTDFGVGGKVTTWIGDPGWTVYDIAFAVEIQVDGKIVVAGESASGTSVIRYDPDGGLDSTFSEDGRAWFSMDSGGGSGARDVLLQPDGNIVVAGTSFFYEGNLAVARLTGGGLPDQTIQENSVFQLTVPVNLFTDPDGDPLAFSAEQADGSALPAWLSFDAPTRTFSGTPREDDAGNVSVRVTATDPHGLSASDLFDLNVVAANAINGTAGGDVLDGTHSNDVIAGGPGNDQMSGGNGADVFKWLSADAGLVGFPAVDTIADFGHAPVGQTDALDLEELLDGENAGNLADYLHFTSSGGDTTIEVRSQGAAGGVDQKIVLIGVDLLPLGSDTDIAASLLANGQLLIS